jgi:hypothetical protein
VHGALELAFSVGEACGAHVLAVRHRGEAITLAVDREEVVHLIEVGPELLVPERPRLAEAILERRVELVIGRPDTDAAPREKPSVDRAGADPLKVLPR